MHCWSSTSTEHFSIVTSGAGWVVAAREQRLSVTWRGREGGSDKLPGGWTLSYLLTFHPGQENLFDDAILHWLGKLHTHHLPDGEEGGALLTDMSGGERVSLTAGHLSTGG